jgi:formylglycine-generating enzyme required for sulfatase activity
MSKGRKKPPPATRLARIFADHPLVDEKLEFEFEGFARTLAELAWNPDNATPFTVVVRGGWGRGKTTLLRRAQWMLDHPGELEEPPPEGVRTVRTLWFNAWKYPDDDTVLAGLLGEVIDRLAQGGKLDQLKQLVASYKSGALTALFARAAPAPLRDLIVDGVDNRFFPVHEKRAFHDTFRRLFNEVSRLQFELAPAFRDTGGLREDQLWTPEKQRREVLAIFLDDLDRCRRERVVEVLEAINLFLDLPGVCFLLGIDWDRLVARLPEAVRGQQQGTQFLEKVVQVAFDLPEVSPSGVEGYVSGLLAGTDLAAVLAGEEDDANADVRVLAGALETRHPRHVKRFLNDLSMTLAVLRNTGKLGESKEEGKEQLPEPAVVAWHLLSEVLPAERWREVRALPQNLRKFLREMEELEAKEADGQRPDDEATEGQETPQEWDRIRASGLTERHLRALHDLSPGQRHLLVYLATPPAVEAEPQRRAALPGRLDLFDPDSAAWVEIPGGTLLMGAQREQPGEQGYDFEAADRESPPHRVTVSPFLLSRYPVTNAEYGVFVREIGKQAPVHWLEGRVPEGKDSHPVVNVSWKDAAAFCEWLTKRLGGENGSPRVGLPTEAQWEFAARGEEGRRYPWGEDEPSDELANFGGNVGDTTPVGSYPDGATPQGIHDLAGNVWEWCQDWYGRYREEDETDPTGPPTSSSRALRGGAFLLVPWSLRASYRDGIHPEFRFERVGFRLCVSS